MPSSAGCDDQQTGRIPSFLTLCCQTIRRFSRRELVCVGWRCTRKRVQPRFVPNALATSTSFGAGASIRSPKPGFPRYRFHSGHCAHLEPRSKSSRHGRVCTRVTKHPRWIFHFTPTSCSWLNAVETVFAKLAKRRLKRGCSRPSCRCKRPSTNSSRPTTVTPSRSSGKPIPTLSSPPPKEGTKR